MIGDLLYVRSELIDLLADYTPFIHLLKRNPKTSIVTLNHDHLVEILLRKSGLNYNDGFSIEKSPLIAPAGNKIHVFDGNFNGSISLIKLHGSIDVYRYEIYNQEVSLINSTGDYVYFKTHNYGTKQSPRLINPLTGEVLQDFHWNISPQFITGTRKQDIISSDSMYAALYTEFSNRILFCSNLMIIGYSYGDEHVNNKIRVAINSGKLVKIVNVNPGITFPFEVDGVEIKNLRCIKELEGSVF